MALHYSEKIRIRLAREELQHLQKKFEQTGESYCRKGQRNFSGYLRDLLLRESNYKNKELLKQTEELRYEIHKIGINVNQVAKKINAGFGHPEDVSVLQSDLLTIQNLLKDYQEEVQRLWESQS